MHMLQWQQLRKDVSVTQTQKEKNPHEVAAHGGSSLFVRQSIRRLIAAIVAVQPFADMVADYAAFLFTVIFIKLCRLLQKNDLLLQVQTFCGWYMVIC